MKHRENTCMDSMICMDIITYIKYIHNMTHTQLNFMKFHDTWYTRHDEPSREDICKHLKSPSHSLTLFQTLLHIEALWVTGSWLWPHSFCGWLHRHVMSASCKVLQSAIGKSRQGPECLWMSADDHRTYSSRTVFDKVQIVSFLQAAIPKGETTWWMF